jgi:hypothetical protein
MRSMVVGARVVGLSLPPPPRFARSPSPARTRRGGLA